MGEVIWVDPKAWGGKEEEPAVYVHTIMDLIALERELVRWAEEAAPDKPCDTE